MTKPDGSDRQAQDGGEGVRALDGKGIASGATLVILLFILSRGTGLLREMIIGARFGASADLDAYLAAFRIPDLLFQLVAGGALGSAFIPTFAAAWTENGHASGQRSGSACGQRRAWLLFSRILNLLTLFLVVLCGLAMLFAEPLTAGVIAPGFSAEQQRLTASLMRWMLASTVVFGASGLIMGALNAVQHFLMPAVAPAVYNCAIIAGAWLLAPLVGIHGLVIGVAGGAALHLVVQLPALLRQGVRYEFSFRVGDAQVREVARLMGPRVLGLLFVQLNFLVNTILASGLPAGSLSALNYAWLLMLLPQGIFAQAVATVAFPTFAAQAAAGNRAQLRATLTGLLRLILFLSMPAAFLLYVLDAPIIELLFQRGRFDAASTQAVAYALRFFCARPGGACCGRDRGAGLLRAPRHGRAGGRRRRGDGVEHSPQPCPDWPIELRRPGPGQQHRHHAGDAPSAPSAGAQAALGQRSGGACDRPAGTARPCGNC